MVELMIVVLIIAILIAIAVPTFLGARDTASSRAAEQNVRSALTAVRASGSDTGGYRTLTHPDLPHNEPQLGWVEGHLVSSGPTEMSVTIDNANEVVTIVASYGTGDCVLIRDWATQAPGVEFASFEGSSGLDCKGDIGSNVAVLWTDGW
jgi:type IV pilus assembly protein PilA